MTQQTEMQTINMATDVLVVGAGMTGIKAATEIAASGYKVIVIEEGIDSDIGSATSVVDLDGEEKTAMEALVKKANASEMIDIMPGTRLDNAAGVTGDFKVSLAGNNGIVEKSVGAIVVASELAASPLNESYGLKLSETVLSQSQMEAALLKDSVAFAGKSIAFMVGLAQDGNPVVLERALKSVLTLEERDDISTYVFTGDLKVAEDGLERFCLECRDKGTIYVKLNDNPSITQESNSLSITYLDPVLQRNVQLTPDIIVIEESVGSADTNTALAKTLKIDIGSMGFLQTDNVHRFPVNTNREGIFVIGGSRRAKKRYGDLMDADNAAIHIQTLLGNGSTTLPVNKAVLDTGKCTFCLTCYRCCPHGAIFWSGDNKPIISPVACQGCGICASECPMDAIQIGDFNDDTIMDTVTKSASEKTTDHPNIVAFCCQNSGMEAFQMAQTFDMPLPKGLKTIAVPCAGKVDINYVMHALAEGADGVVIMACYNGNCKSEHGSLYASWRAGNAQDMIEAAGLSKDCIFFASTASNMGIEFSNILMDMEARLMSK